MPVPLPCQRLLLPYTTPTAAVGQGLCRVVPLCCTSPFFQVKAFGEPYTNIISFARGQKSFSFPSNSYRPKEEAINLSSSFKPSKEAKGVPRSYRKIIQLPGEQGKHRTISQSIWVLKPALKNHLSLPVAEA